MNYLHAQLQATLYNAHFVGPDDLTWTADELLGRGDRKAREMQRMKDKMITRQMQSVLVAPIDESQVPEFILELEANQKATVN